MFIFTGTLLYDSDRSVLATVSDPVQSLATSINDQGPAGMKLKLKLINICTGSTSHDMKWSFTPNHTSGFCHNIFKQ